MQPVNKLTKLEAEIELKRIAEEMAKSDIAYYQNDNPYLTDAEYDSLKKRNEEIGIISRTHPLRQSIKKGWRRHKKRIR